MGKEWKSYVHLNAATGQRESTYTYMGRKCVKFVLDSHLCKQMLAYAAIERDLTAAIVWLKKISDIKLPSANDALHVDSSAMVDREIVKALFVAAISFYGKCFTVGDGRSVKLERIMLPEELRETHDTAMTYRHDYVSHSGSRGIESGRAYFVRQKNIERGKPFGYGIKVEMFQPDLVWFREGDSNLWIELFEGARSVAEKKLNLLQEKIYVEEIESKSDELFGLGFEAFDSNSRPD
ncbi:hypothetical protein ACU680_05765 [Pseudomonas koreensis]